MSAVGSRRKNVRSLGLLASASLMSILMTTEAQAACVAASASPLNNLTVDGDFVDCNGANSGQTIGVNANTVQVRVDGAADSLTNSSVALAGSSNTFTVDGGATVTNLAFTANGTGNQLNLVNGTITNFSAITQGGGTQIVVGSGATATATPGSVLQSNTNGNDSFILLGNMAATGNSGGNFLLNGGSGSQSYNLQGTLTVQPNGLAIFAGDDNDQITIGSAAVINGGTGNNILFDGGGGTGDQISITRSGSWNYSTANIETLFVGAGAGNTLQLNGTGNYTTVVTGAGTIQVSDFAALGQSNSLVSVSGAGRLRLTPTAAASFFNSLSGAGQVEQVGQTITYNGTNSSFTGNFLISGGTAVVNSGSQFGTGTITNNSALQLTNVTLNNAISGTGTVTKTGGGTGTLGGGNTYNGGTTVLGGTLRLTNNNAAGINSISLANGTFLDLDLGAASASLANGITGAGGLIKSGTGTIDLDGTNGYSGGTTINAGAIRVDGFARLGTGPVVANSGGSLILSYNGAGQLLQTTPFMTGTGSFIKEGTGDVVMNQTSTYTGGTIIREGRIGLNNGDALGTGNVQVDAGAILGIGGITLANTITGSGSVIKTGNNIGFLLGDNSGFSGAIDIQQGQLRIENGNALGTGSVNIGSGLALQIINSTSDSVIDAAIGGSGDFYKSDANRVTLTGTNTISGLIIVDDGVLQIGGSQNVGTATIDLFSAGSVLDLSTTGTTTFVNDVQGAGRIVKTGTGTVLVTGSNSYAGGTDIQQGAIRVTDVSFLGTGPITVQSGAALDLSIAGSQTLNQNVTGAGMLRKSDAGDLTLLGNGLTGGVDVVGGRVIVNTAGALGGGPVTLGADTQLVFDNAVTEVMANPIGGAGALTKDGAGLLVIQNANTYTGGTIINAGRLGLNNGQGLGTGDVIVLSGAELGIGGVTLANNVSGAGKIVKTANNVGTLTGTNTHTGGIDIQAGTVAVTGNAALGTGAISIASGASLDYTNATAATFSNGLSGAGSFNKLGAGQLTFANNFAVGSLNLSAGRTRINTIGTTNVTVGASATLDGIGRINGNLVNNGKVAPGNSIGTLTVAGNYIHNAGSVLEIEFDAAGNIDLLDVTGNATLNGGTLRFVSIGGAEGQGGTFLRTGGTLTGTFATVETVGALLPLAVVYEPNRAFMAPSVLTARPSTFNAQSLAAGDTALGFIDSIGVGDVRHGTGNRLWLTGFGAWGSRSASGSTLAYDHDTRGISGGVNFAVGDAVTLGAAVGWAKGDITLGANGGGGEQSSVLGSVTARYSGTGFTLGGGVLFGKVDQDTLRNVSFNGFSGSVSGETESKLFGAFAELGLPLGSTGGWAFSANARGSYVRQDQDGYTESGTSPLRLTLGDLATSTMEGQARLTAKTKLWAPEQQAEDSPEGLDLRIDLGGRYLGTLGDREIPVTFAVSNAGIVLQGDTRDTLQGLAGLSLDYTSRSGATFSLGYRGEFGKTDRHAVQAGVSFAF